MNRRNITTSSGFLTSLENMDDIDLTEISDTSFVADTPRYVHEHVVNDFKLCIISVKHMIYSMPS